MEPPRIFFLWFNEAMYEEILNLLPARQELEKIGVPKEVGHDRRLRLLWYIGNGLSFDDACDLSGVKRSTARAWIAADPDFEDAVGAASAALVALATLKVMSSDDWRAQKSMLEALRPLQFSPPQAVQRALRDLMRQDPNQVQGLATSGGALPQDAIETEAKES